jgi:hypothetical protein
MNRELVITGAPAIGKQYAIMHLLETYPGSVVIPQLTERPARKGEDLDLTSELEMNAPKEAIVECLIGVAAKAIKNRLPGKIAGCPPPLYDHMLENQQIVASHNPVQGKPYRYGYINRESYTENGLQIYEPSPIYQPVSSISKQGFKLGLVASLDYLKTNMIQRHKDLQIPFDHNDMTGRMNLAAQTNQHIIANAVDYDLIIQVGTEPSAEFTKNSIVFIHRDELLVVITEIAGNILNGAANNAG